MSNMFIIGKRLVPVDHVALVEGYQPTSSTRLQTTREFSARVVLINRDSILTEDTVEMFAADKNFKVIPGESVAINPRVRFRIETFTPAEGFTPTKPYRTRLIWRDLDGNDQSKLLLAEPETVLEIATGTARATSPEENGAPGQQSRRATTRRKPRHSNPVATV